MTNRTKVNNEPIDKLIEQIELLKVGQYNIAIELDYLNFLVEIKSNQQEKLKAAFEPCKKLYKDLQSAIDQKVLLLHEKIQQQVNKAGKIGVKSDQSKKEELKFVETLSLFTTTTRDFANERAALKKEVSKKTSMLKVLQNTHKKNISAACDVIRDSYEHNDQNIDLPQTKLIETLSFFKHDFNADTSSDLNSDDLSNDVSSIESWLESCPNLQQKCEKNPKLQSAVDKINEIKVTLDDYANELKNDLPGPR